MLSYTCVICGYSFKEENGVPEENIPPKTCFEDFPKDFKCPVCNSSIEFFESYF